MAKTRFQLQAEGALKLTTAHIKRVATEYDAAVVLYEQSKDLYIGSLGTLAVVSDPADLEDKIKQNLGSVYKNWAASLILKSETDLLVKEASLLRAIVVLEEVRADYIDAIEDNLYTAYHNLGLHYQTLADLAHAIEYLNKAKAIKADEMFTLYSLGLCHLANNDYPEAEVEFRASIDLAIVANNSQLALNSFCKLIKSQIEQYNDTKATLEEAFAYLSVLDGAVQIVNVDSANMICSQLAQRQLIDGDDITDTIALSRLINAVGNANILVTQLTDAALYLNSIGQTEDCTKMLVELQEVAVDASQIKSYLSVLWLEHPINDDVRKAEILGADDYTYTIVDFDF